MPIASGFLLIDALLDQAVDVLDLPFAQLLALRDYFFDIKNGVAVIGSLQVFMK
jgi:hypothetical protein